jgi:arylformamidase
MEMGNDRKTLKKSPSITALTLKLEAVLKDAGIPAKRFAARETNHSKLNENLGLPHVPPTKALFEFVEEALKK